MITIVLLSRAIKDADLLEHLLWIRHGICCYQLLQTLFKIGIYAGIVGQCLLQPLQRHTQQIIAQVMQRDAAIIGQGLLEMYPIGIV